MLTRRKLFHAAGAVTALGLTQANSAQSQTSASDSSNSIVRLSGDGIGLQPQEFTELLDSLCQNQNIESDNYLLGGEVEKFERYCAELLDKEMAVFMPSGTLANQLALRQIAGENAE